MSFIFSRALVEASLQVSCLAVDAYAPLNLIPTRKQSSLHDRTTVPFLRSRFGMTFEPLTEDLGEELLTSWLAGFPVKTSAQQERVKESTASEAGYGQRWRGSFAKFDHDLSLWRTAQCSLLEDSDEFSETWPRWGSMRNGESFLRPIPALRICASESGSEVIWPTPTASLANKGGRITPRKSREGVTLIEAISSRMWPTPRASASKGSSQAALTRKSGKSRANDRIDHAVMASDGGQLNPEWVEWLMGWPIGHTALEPLETGRYREWLYQHGLHWESQ